MMGIQSGGCALSYPELCPDSAVDLNCEDVGFALTVICDESIGGYDPHGFD
jgi:hypothetical protein